jgi:hypothetical protein
LTPFRAGPEPLRCCLSPLMASAELD